jgi:hypothetical protein
MSIQARKKVCWEARCDHCGDGDNIEYGAGFHYVSRDEALQEVTNAEWIEQDGVLLCQGCIENEDYPSEDVDKAVASLIAKVRAAAVSPPQTTEKL